MFRKALACTVLSVLAATSALAQAADVYCGTYTPIKFRVAAAGKDAQSRANQAMDVINKYLGGKAPTVTTKAEGANVKLLIQKDVVGVVTPADAKAEKAKSAKALAQIWVSKLNKALKESSAQK